MDGYILNLYHAIAMNRISLSKLTNENDKQACQLLITKLQEELLSLCKNDILKDRLQTYISELMGESNVYSIEEITDDKQKMIQLESYLNMPPDRYYSPDEDGDAIIYTILQYDINTAPDVQIIINDKLPPADVSRILKKMVDWYNRDDAMQKLVEF